MPTTRRFGLSTSPALSPSTPRAARLPASASGPGRHHHESSDELARREAAKLLHLTEKDMEAGSEAVDGSARGARHARLSEARQSNQKRSSGRLGEDIERSATEEGESSIHPGADDDEQRTSESFDGQKESAAAVASLTGALEEQTGHAETDGSASSHGKEAGSSGSEISSETSESDSDDASGSRSSSPETSETYTDKDEDHNKDEDDGEDEEEERLEKLLQAARLSAMAKQSAIVVADRQDVGEVDPEEVDPEEVDPEEVVLQLDQPRAGIKEA